jgi:hypothetical protein
MLVVTVCSMDATFQVTVEHGALVHDLVDAMAESRGIANARRLVAMFVGGGDGEALAGTQSAVGCMADVGANELFMLLREPANDRQVLEDIYNLNDGDNWAESSGWMTDAPISKWHGVTADLDDNVTKLSFWDTEIAGACTCSQFHA